jgi:hypothetical protein
LLSARRSDATIHVRAEAARNISIAAENNLPLDFSEEYFIMNVI